MIKQVLDTIKEILRSPTIQDTLEEYIAARNPQTSDDVDRLEREFYNRRRNAFYDKYY